MLALRRRAGADRRRDRPARGLLAGRRRRARDVDGRDPRATTSTRSSRARSTPSSSCGCRRSQPRRPPDAASCAGRGRGAEPVSLLVARTLAIPWRCRRRFVLTAQAERDRGAARRAPAGRRADRLRRAARARSCATCARRRGEAAASSSWSSPTPRGCSSPSGDRALSTARACRSRHSARSTCGRSPSTRSPRSRTASTRRSCERCSTRRSPSVPIFDVMHPGYGGSAAAPRPPARADA